MSSSRSPAPTSNTADAKSRTEADAKAALSKLIEDEVEPLLQRIKREYRWPVDEVASTDHDSDTEGGARDDSSNKKLVPTVDQRKAFAALSALFCVGKYATGSAGGSMKVWQDVLATEDDASTELVTGYLSRLHLQMTSDDKSGPSSKGEDHGSAAETVPSGNVKNSQPATSLSVDPIERSARDIIDKARAALDRGSDARTAV